MYRAGFSLASILLLTAVIAVLLAALATALTGPGPMDRELVAVASVAGLALGGPIGAWVAFQQTGRIRGMLLGLLVGMVAGGVSGALLVLPKGLPALAVGSVVIVLFSAVVRLSSTPPRNP